VWILLRGFVAAKTGYCINFFMVENKVKANNIECCQRLFKGFPKFKLSVAI
jgi:hypothetical protein